MTVTRASAGAATQKVAVVGAPSTVNVSCVQFALGKGCRAGSEETDERSAEGPSEETHISNNAVHDAIVAVRPMRREDVDAFAGWARHADPLFDHYNLPALTAGAADDLWTFLSSTPDVRRPYAGLADERVVATLVVRNIDPAERSGELGIMLDPAYLGRGLGRRILGAFAAVLANEGFRRAPLRGGRVQWAGDRRVSGQRVSRLRRILGRSGTGDRHRRRCWPVRRPTPSRRTYASSPTGGFGPAPFAWNAGSTNR